MGAMVLRHPQQVTGMQLFWQILEITLVMAQWGL
jgi:hypothetical protein